MPPPAASGKGYPVLQEVRAVVYLLAIIGLVALTVAFWRAFGPQSIDRPAKRVMGPDDDPEFLRRLGPGASPPHD